MFLVNRWGEDSPDERYWLEVTNRDDLGADLNAPQRDETGEPRWSDELLKDPADGDVVFHYWKRQKSIVAFSIARGVWWEGEVIWSAQGRTARARKVESRRRPGYRRTLQQFTALTPPIELARANPLREDLMRVRDELVREHSSPTYFPFVFPYNAPFRPTQGYLLKMP